jgi:hypothetical protein
MASIGALNCERWQRPTASAQAVALAVKQSVLSAVASAPTVVAALAHW